MKYILLTLSITMSSCNNSTQSQYPKTLYWENGNTATQINDSIIIVSDRKSFNETESYIFNLNISKIIKP